MAVEISDKITFRLMLRKLLLLLSRSTSLKSNPCAALGSRKAVLMAEPHSLRLDLVKIEIHLQEENLH